MGNHAFHRTCAALAASVILGLAPAPSASALTLVKDGRVDPAAWEEVLSILRARHGQEYAAGLAKAFGRTHEPGRELFRVMPNCFINQGLMHFSGTPLSVTFRPTEVNTCLFCHQPAIAEYVDDSVRQKTWPQTTENVNPWPNVFDPTWLDAVVPPASIPTKISDYVLVNNLREAIARSGVDLDNPSADHLTVRAGKGRGALKFFPDLNPAGVDSRTGWANNGWRAFKWKPQQFSFPSALGGWKQIFIRLPVRFRQDARGGLSRDVYAKNLDLLERAIKGEPTPASYFGGASKDPVKRYFYPTGTEFILAIHYLDPIKGKAVRLQDYRYMVKSVPDDDIAIDATEDTAAGKPSSVPDPPAEYDKTLESLAGGAANPYGVVYAHAGWDLVAYLEQDPETGRFRPAIQEENQFCLGCHGRSLGVMRDGIWSLQRKLPGDEGWRLQDFAQIKDYVNKQTDKGDFFEWITETAMSGLALFPYVDNDHLDLRGGLPLGGYDHALLIYRKYYQIVKTQTHLLGRFPSATTVPPVVFEKIVNRPERPLRGAQESYIVTKRVSGLDFGKWQGVEESERLARERLDKTLDRMKQVVQGTYTAYRREELIERLEEAKRGLRPSLQSLGKSQVPH
jgi:hypothetical protein